MKRLFVFFILVIIIIAFVTSCKKYLDTKPDKKLDTPSTIESLQGLLDNTYTMNNQTPDLGEVSTTDYYYTNSEYQAYSPFDRSAYLWDSAGAIFQSGQSNGWADVYNTIYNANLCLENIEKIKLDAQNQQQWNNIKGSALLYRGKAYLDAVWLWGAAYDPNTAKSDLGLPLKLNSDFNEVSQRESLEDTYSQIIKDIKESATFLPAISIHAMRPSKTAAFAFLARAYLSMRNYDSCYKYAELSLQINNSITDYNSYYPLTGLFAFDFYLPIKEVIMHCGMKQNYNATFFFNLRVDSSLYDLYDSNDLRKVLFFSPKGDGTYFYCGSYNQVTPFSGVTTAEVYLMRAEYYARKGNTTLAMEDLNALIEKRWNNAVTFTPFTATDANDALAQILIERRKELIFRGLRWMDIKRLNKEGANIVLKRLVNGQIFSMEANDLRYALPIPPDVIQISNIRQNPR